MSGSCKRSHDCVSCQYISGTVFFVAGLICMLGFSVEYYLDVRLVPTQCIVRSHIDDVSVCYEDTYYYPRTALIVYCYDAFDIAKNVSVVWCHKRKVGCGDTSVDIANKLSAYPITSAYPCWYWLYDSIWATPYACNDWRVPLISGVSLVLLGLALIISARLCT